MLFHNDYEFNSRNQQRLTQLILDTANNHSKLLPIRLDLYLSSDNFLDITYHDIKQCWQNFQNNMRHNSVFDHLLSWAANIEYGEDRGWHIHVLMLFNGQRLKDDYGKAQDLGDYWVSLVEQRDSNYIGNYYSGNTHKHRYETLALKTIDSSQRSYETDLQTLINACSYLAKTSSETETKMLAEGAFQQRSDHRQFERRFFIAQVKPKSNRGRPRNSQQSSQLPKDFVLPSRRNQQHSDKYSTASPKTSTPTIGVSIDNFHNRWAYAASLLND